MVGDTVGDPFKDTTSVALNPIIKFTTLFGLLAVELAITLDRGTSALLRRVFGAVMLFFVWRSLLRHAHPERRQPEPVKSEQPAE